MDGLLGQRGQSMQPRLGCERVQRVLATVAGGGWVSHIGRWPAAGGDRAAGAGPGCRQRRFPGPSEHEN